MGYLNNQVVTVDAILTTKEKELLAKNDGSFRITTFFLTGGGEGKEVGKG